MSPTTAHADYDQANKLVLVFVLGSRALYNPLFYVQPIPVITRLQSALDAILHLIKRRCSKDRCFTIRYQCRRVGFQCTDLCSCNDAEDDGSSDIGNDDDDESSGDASVDDDSNDDEAEEDE